MAKSYSQRPGLTFHDEIREGLNAVFAHCGIRSLVLVVTLLMFYAGLPQALIGSIFSFLGASKITFEINPDGTDRNSLSG